MTPEFRASIVPIDTHDLSRGVNAVGLGAEAAGKIDGRKVTLRQQKAVTMDYDRRIPYFVGAHDIAGFVDPLGSRTGYEAVIIMLTGTKKVSRRKITSFGNWRIESATVPS
jgi:hypothetical protein